MPDLRLRADFEELLDSPEASEVDLERSLSDLALANRWLGGKRTLAPHIIPLLGSCSSILDIACGGGDMLRWLSQESGQGKKRLCGIDLNPRVVRIARDRCRGYADIAVAEGDAVSLPFEDRSFDLVISSTFVHHLDPAAVVRALCEADRVSARRVAIADLVRSDVGRIGVGIAGRLLFGRLSRYDGPVSFRRAYTPPELLHMAREAGLRDPRVHAGVLRMVLVSDKERA